VRKQEDIEEALLKRFLEYETNACHATNLHRLLTKRWNESPNSYRICSKITPRKERRIKDIIVENRYS
jgi:hypothetical protein